MKDIKSLFLAAKSSGRDKDISAYQEAVNELFEHNPYDYILQLEYIISSSIGLSTFKPFVEKYGLSIACYDDAMAHIEKSIGKCHAEGVDDSNYKDTIAWMESFRNKYANCFAMFEYYQDMLSSDYVSTYYGFNNNGIQNCKLLSGMVGKFGEAAIPDMIITADEIGPKAMNTLLEYIDGRDEDPVFYEWVTAAATDHVSSEYKEKYLDPISRKSPSVIVESMHARNQQVFRESVIMGDDDAVYEYSEEEIDAIQNLISFKEYTLTQMDGSNIEAVMEAQKEIYSLYEELDGVIFEEDDRVGEEKKDTDFVPIFGVVKSYSTSKYRSDGSKKSESEVDSIKFKKQVKTLTKGDNYTHVAISFDEDLTKMYSFDNEGFVEDSIMNDSWLGTESIYLTVMFVTKSEKSQMKKYVNDLIKHKAETSYALANLIRAYAGKPTKSDKRYVCSSFTGYILQCGNPKNLHRDYSRLRPEDITILPRAFYVMNVKDKMEFIKKKDEFSRRIKEIYNEYKEDIKDYNNHLPRLMLKDRMDKLKTLDKILDWISDRVFS